MINEEYLKLKEKISHGSFKIPMEVYKGQFGDKCSFYSHWHDEMEFLYIVKGSGKIYIDLTTYEITEGDFVIIPKGALHYIFMNKTNEINYEAIVFNLSMLENNTLDFCQINFINPLIDNKLFIIKIIHTCDKDYNEILQCFKNIIHSFYNRKLGFQLEIKGLFFVIFSYLFSNEYIKNWDKIDSNPNNKIEKMKTVIGYIEKNYNRPISIKELAEIAQYSEYHFIRFFKEQTGKTCTEFINSLRIQKAADLLLKTNLSITDIAYEIGFGDISYFIKTFKKYFSLSPSNYRKNN